MASVLNYISMLLSTQTGWRNPRHLEVVYLLK
jgi:hypothetical protein